LLLPNRNKTLKIITNFGFGPISGGTPVKDLVKNKSHISKGGKIQFDIQD